MQALVQMLAPAPANRKSVGLPKPKKRPVGNNLPAFFLSDDPAYSFQYVWFGLWSTPKPNFPPSLTSGSVDVLSSHIDANDDSFIKIVIDSAVLLTTSTGTFPRKHVEFGPALG